jgi:hypothetical protein
MGKMLSAAAAAWVEHGSPYSSKEAAAVPANAVPASAVPFKDFYDEHMFSLYRQCKAYGLMSNNPDDWRNNRCTYVGKSHADLYGDNQTGFVR